MLISDLVEQVSKILITHEKMLVTAESCTGGLIAKVMTDRPGSSAVFERGFVTYSNNSKIDLLGISPSTLETYGAVSEQVAREMATGALRNSNADIALSVTGIAGPGGESSEKPVGLVYICTSFLNQTQIKTCYFNGTREEIRNQSAEASLELVFKSLAKLT